jgi:hypothetical protein
MTYPILVHGTRLRLSAPQWEALVALVAALRRRQQTDFLLWDIFPPKAPQASIRRRILAALAGKGVLERVPAGYRLSAGIVEQVEAALQNGKE